MPPLTALPRLLCQNCKRLGPAGKVATKEEKWLGDRRSNTAVEDIPVVGGIDSDGGGGPAAATAALHSESSCGRVTPTVAAPSRLQPLRVVGEHAASSHSPGLSIECKSGRGS